MSQARRTRVLGVKADRSKNDKDGERKDYMGKTRLDARYPSPVGFSENFSPIGNMHGHLPKLSARTMMSSPLVDAISHGKSSAFKVVATTDASAVKTSKRQVLGAIDSNVPLPHRSPRTPEDSALPISTKRVLDDSANSSTGAATRKRRCSKSLNTKSAFSQERKTKSAEAILTGTRPLPVFSSHSSSFAGLRSSYRPISAPILMVSLSLIIMHITHGVIRAIPPVHILKGHFAVHTMLSQMEVQTV